MFVVHSFLSEIAPRNVLFRKGFSVFDIFWHHALHFAVDVSYLLNTFLIYFA